MNEINPDIKHDPEKIKTYPAHLHAALGFLQEHGEAEDDGANFDVLLSVRKSKLVYMGSPNAAKKTTKFPMTYRGWLIAIKMGHQFKGTRGAVAQGKRGYIASKPDDVVGTYKEFRPTYDTAPSLTDVKRAIDVEEMSRRRKTL